MHVAFDRSPRKSVCVASTQLSILRSTVHKNLTKTYSAPCLQGKIVQALKQLQLKKFYAALDDRPHQAALAERILHCTDDDND